MKKVLIVDDEALIREGLELALRNEGYGVEVAGNGEEALQVLEHFRPDVIVTDIIMPEKDGIELVLNIRKIDKSIRIIAISGGGRISANDHLKMASQLGANSILAKPFSISDLIAEIENSK